MRSGKKIWTTLLTVSSLCAATPLLADFTIPAADNRPLQIVIPAEANPVEKYAARELQQHLLGFTGREPQIIAEAEFAAGKTIPIFVGATASAAADGADFSELKPNSYRKIIRDDAVVLYGPDGDKDPVGDDTTRMGTLFAVYDFLENDLGVRWLWPGDAGTAFLAGSSVTLTTPQELTGQPSLAHSRIRESSGLGTWERAFANPEELRIANLERQVWLRRHRFARPVSFEYGHAYESYWGRFGATGEHPDFFALRSTGERTPYDEPRLVQMCVSNPELHRQIVEDWRNNRQSYRGDFINGAENDKRFTDEFCRCEKCMAWDPPGTVYNDPKDGIWADGAWDPKEMKSGLSDRYAKFWLALQKEGSKYRKDPIVIGYAYFDYAEPPRETRLNDRIFVGIVPNFDYPLDSGHRDAFRNQWAGWNQAGASLYLRPNYFLNGYSLPYIFARQFGEDYQFAYDHGMVGTDFDSLTGMFGTQGPNLYMLAKLNSRPDMPVDDVLDEYYAGFGPAAAAVREYFEFWEQVTNGRTNAFVEAYPAGGWNRMGWSGHFLFSMEHVAAAEKILEQAVLQCAGDAAARARVEYLRLGLKHTQLSLQAMNRFELFKADRQNDELKKQFLASVRELDVFRYAIRNLQVVNPVILDKLELWMGWHQVK